MDGIADKAERFMDDVTDRALCEWHLRTCDEPLRSNETLYGDCCSDTWRSSRVSEGLSLLMSNRNMAQAFWSAIASSLQHNSVEASMLVTGLSLCSDYALTTLSLRFHYALAILCVLLPFSLWSHYSLSLLSRCLNLATEHTLPHLQPSSTSNPAGNTSIPSTDPSLH